MSLLENYSSDFTATIMECLLENPSMIYVIVDKYGYITAMDKTYLGLLGMKKEDVIGKHILDVTPKSELPDILSTGRIDKADIWTINGQETIITRMPIVKNGEIIGAIAKSLFMDISGARSLVNKLQESEEQYTIIEGLIESPDMVYVIIDKDACITAINQTYLDLLKMKKEQVVGKHILDITPESRLPVILETGHIDEADTWCIKGHDTIITRMPIIKNGNIIGAIAKSIFLDMSAARILVDKLEEREKEFTIIIDRLIESPHIALVIVDRDGYITFMNQTFLDTLELKRTEVIGKYVRDILPHSELPDVLDTGRIDKADIWPIAGRDTVVSRIPLIKDDNIIGAIGQSFFLDMSSARIILDKLRETKKELDIYKKEVCQIYTARWKFKDLIGRSPQFVEVRSMAQQLANTVSTLLITGESGTGKELFAHAVHNASKRASGPFVRINCAALPENLLESELFGYEEGAFTGAKKGGKPGKFELAQGGTIFLDEIGDMPLLMQTKLLSILQERIIERVGGTIPIPIDVRVIAATSRDLERMVAHREFREDFYYRLNVVRINLPSLRERMDDLPLLVKDLVNRINANLNTHIFNVSEDAMKVLYQYSWPGNVRELENLVERAINLADMNQEKCITAQHFPSLLVKTTEAGNTPAASGKSLPELVENLERQIIDETLKKTGGNKLKTAKILGIHNSALYRKLKKYNLEE